MHRTSLLIDSRFAGRVGATLILVLANGCAWNSPGRQAMPQPYSPYSTDADSLQMPRIVEPTQLPANPPANPPANNPATVIRGQDTNPPTSGSPVLVDPYSTTVGGPQFSPPGQAAPMYPGVAPQQPGLMYGQSSTQQYPSVGDPNALNPLIAPVPPSGLVRGFPENFADIDVYVQEAQTGRIMIGGAYNSDNGLTGQITIDERNFDITRFPRSWRDIADGRAFRGAGQGFRMELLPGSEVQRYLVSFSEPFLLNTNVSFTASGYYFTRNYFDWDEQRLGGQFSLGYRLTPELSVSAGTRLESVDIFDPRVMTSPDLNAALGESGLYLGFVRLVHDTRDHPFLPTEGGMLEMSYTQAFGDYDYPRGDVEYRRYFLVYQRDDGSGRHTLSVGSRLGITGSDTPVFENYFAGGFSTMRGFDLRGASPLQGGVRVGGEFQWLNSVEYMFPLTADDMIRGVLFCDFGTVEEEVTIASENFRVAPGFGFRVHMPAAGMGGAPLAFDFAFPVATAAGDDEQMFSFYMGIAR
jgi:outer membrane protein insertion porin family